MNGYVIDSTVWIDYSNGKRSAGKFLGDARGSGRVACSVISVMEVLEGSTNAVQLRELESIFKALKCCPLPAKTAGKLSESSKLIPARPAPELSMR